MEWIYTATEPQPVERKTHLGMRQRTVNYNIVPLGENSPTGYKFKHQAVTLEPGVWHYDAIVSALVSAEYPRDKMDAIVNNYLADPTNDNAIEEMLEMQNWRKAAKQIAKEVLAIDPETPGVQNYPPGENDAIGDEA